MRDFVRSLLVRALNYLKAPEQLPDVKQLMAENLRLRREEMYAQRRQEMAESIAELEEAAMMAGSGPWKASSASVASTKTVIAEAREQFKSLREALVTDNTVGAWGELDLMLDLAQWRRETQFSWLQFSRWGIQQIILLSRLYWLKNPLIRRGIDIAAAYVFGRGVEISSPDETAQATLEDFLERNKRVFGQYGLTKQERRKYYDGNLFYALFTDKVNTGEVNVRVIDATEIQDIISDPEDREKEWYYLRSYSQNNFDALTGRVSPTTVQSYYPALNYEPNERPDKINGYEVHWDSPIYHRKVGEVADWQFGCPRVYPAIEWARTAKKYLEACYTTAQSHAQIAWQLTTKGGQAALAGMKQQLSTTAGTNPGATNGWDTNPQAITGSVFGSGPGTSMLAVKTRGAGGDPSEVKEYKIMVAIVLGIPPTFLGDLETSNMATATTLDRPTELGFLERQEEWREDLLTICQYVLKVSLGAGSGRMRESFKSNKVEIRPAKYKLLKSGRRVMEAQKKDGTVEISVNFPAIREGDIPQLVKAVVEAMTLDNKMGQVTGIDEKAGVRKLYDLLGIENGDELTEEAYPDGEYDPDRTKEPPPPPSLIPPTGNIPPSGRNAAAA